MEPDVIRIFSAKEDAQAEADRLNAIEEAKDA